MAKRPVFVPNQGSPLVHEYMIDFPWHSGMATSQKKKNVAELHKAAKASGLGPLLEVSTKSDAPLGFRLSAFNLEIEIRSGQRISVESAYQGSKVFTGGRGPYTDLYGKSGGVAKKDKRLLHPEDLDRFVDWDGQEWELEPKTAFYDWLYMNALHQDESLREQIFRFKGFTDIEFNPKRSINCQAHSCALYVSLCRDRSIDDVLRNRDLLIEMLRDSEKEMAVQDFGHISDRHRERLR